METLTYMNMTYAASFILYYMAHTNSLNTPKHDMIPSQTLYLAIKNKLCFKHVAFQCIQPVIIVINHRIYQHYLSLCSGLIVLEI